MDVVRSTMVAWVVFPLAQQGEKIALIVEFPTILQVAASNYLKTKKTTLMPVLEHLLLMSTWRMMSFTCASGSVIVLTEASLTPTLEGKQSNHKSKELIFPGASICIGGTHDPPNLGLTVSDLIPCQKKSKLHPNMQGMISLSV